MSVRDEILQIVHRELNQAVPPEARAVADRIREIHGSVVRGILFYGSCLRAGCDDGVLDLYVFVDTYRGAYTNPGLVLLNRLLPPNVFYLEVEADGRVARAKYAVLALRDLGRFTSAKCFEPYFWARFAQPCALVAASDDGVRDQIARALVDAIVTFVRRGVPLVAPRFTSRDLWVATWRETYRGELRAERPEIVDRLWASSSQRYEQVTERALRVAGLSARAAMDGDTRQHEVRVSKGSRRRALVLWRLRRFHSKVRFIMRLVRNALIFEGGADYILWKIQRHSGIQTDREWRSKRRPLLALGAEAWRLYKAGAFR